MVSAKTCYFDNTRPYMQSVAINLKTATESKKKYEIDIVRPKVKALLVLYKK